MDPVIFEETPLAAYLKGIEPIPREPAPAEPRALTPVQDEGDDSEVDWAPVERTSSRESSVPTESSPHTSPVPMFAPIGRPQVKPRFRSHIPSALRLDTSRTTSLQAIRRSYSAAVAAKIDRADNAKFLEQFRYIIVASQLLSAHSVPGQHQYGVSLDETTIPSVDEPSLSTQGVLTSIMGALSVALICSWLLGSAPSQIKSTHILLLVLVLGACMVLGQIHMRMQWLQYRRKQVLSELKSFVSRSHDFDSAMSAALGLVQEVELVSRGYRLSAPLPPISRLEDRSQTRKCNRLRKAAKTSLMSMLRSYNQVSLGVKGFSEQTELEKYYDIYDITDFDISDTLRAADDSEFDDAESLRALKILAARFHTTRRMFLCALLALDANGDGSDLVRWTKAVDALQDLIKSTTQAYDSLRKLMSEEETFVVPPTPMGPQTPGRERWRSQLRKLNSLSTGIRGLQAKLQLLREESDRTLNNSDDISEFGPNLMSQYDSIGVDLKELMSAWEEGKAALAQGIDRNEKRLSSLGALLSPTPSLSGLTTVNEDGSAADAFRALTGESPPPSVSNDAGSSEGPEVFEAVALPRARSTLSREERIAKMREDREQKAVARQQIDATKGMLRELETVINLRPRNRTSIPMTPRVVSM
ncbi:Mysoin-binding motif of peroxisomes-domain-containing protein [Stachybotrys elegans]|uniref:Vezatin n=1 Tax=Stachybotrys elegans TaxID=80388 RepID=A0A8K0WW84_9HYPO|nr:Mysoin-binding motif of peroxisomes-domain-containing protein [Stachybotrys elegans]